MGVDVQIRWMIRRDMPEVLDVEAASFPCPWTEDDFINCLMVRNRIGHVAEYGERIAGFMIYEFHKAALRVINFAVAPQFRRQGVGRQMVEKLIAKLSQQRRHQITLEVRESNLDAQLFFRELGFQCVGVVREAYLDWGTTEDGYVMVYQIGEPEFPNRIAGYLQQKETK